MFVVGLRIQHNKYFTIFDSLLHFVKVLDGLIDKVVSACNQQIQGSSLDPLIIEDIAIPFSLEKVTGSCGPLGGLLSLFCSCLGKSVEGEIFLRNGELRGLASLTRSVPTTVEVEDGCVKLSAGLGLRNLQSPFEPSISIYQPSSDPEVSCEVKSPH